MNEKKKTLRADLCLIGVLLLAALVAFAVLKLSQHGGAWAVVSVDGQEVARYPLAADVTVPLNGGTNTLVIEHGTARIEDANCPDKLCVHQGRIQYTGEAIVCLPNKLTVTVEGAEDNGVDFVS